MGPAGEVIPQRIIDKPPSAELREDQKDSDSLPDYPVLDGILDILVDQDGSIADCVAAGFARDGCKKVEHLLYISEYKRFQSAPGARLTKRAFWLDRRYPIVNRWRETASWLSARDGRTALISIGPSQSEAQATVPAWVPNPIRAASFPHSSRQS
jgi:NAD+ synthase